MSAALSPCLEVAIALRIAEIKANGYISDSVFDDAIFTADLIAHKGDTLLYGGQPKQAAEIFNKVARAIAVLSFQPGGFHCMGMKFESEFTP